MHVKTFQRLWRLPLALLMCLLAVAAHAESSQVFQGRFLIATDQLVGTGFDQAVIYVTRDSKLGTYGLIINRPTGIPMKEILPEDDKNPHAADQIFFGGPVHGQHIFMLAETDEQENLHWVVDKIYLAAGMEMLNKLTHDDAHPNVRAYAGFASWAPGQLEVEIEAGAWVVAPATVEQLFDTHPEKLWKALHDRWSGRWL